MKNLLKHFLKLRFRQDITYNKKLLILKKKLYPSSISPTQGENLELFSKKNDNQQVNTIISKALDWQTKPENHILTYNCKLYPKLLKEIPNPPLLLFVKGNPNILCNPQIAIVGSRKASKYGLGIAHSFSESLCEQGITITSGLALGIDSKAHRGAVDKPGKTIAVLGSGLENIYPLKNKDLAFEIHNKGGALVSEYFLDEPPHRYNFPMRNRIISGMSLGTLVAEANLKSGSMITAKNALEQNREVFTVSANINTPSFSGCHELIRQGAKLVENLTHILEEFSNYNLPNIQKHVRNPKTEDKGTRKLKTSASENKLRTVKLLEQGPMMVEELCNITSMQVNDISAILIELELEGYIINDSGYYFCAKHINKIKQ